MANATEAATTSLSNHPHVPPEWIGRRLYFGAQGLRRWRAAREKPGFIDPDALQIEQLYQAALQCLDDSNRNQFPAVFVSLGPGDGSVDHALVQSMVKHQPDIRFIPVDIGIEMLAATCDVLGNDTKIPFSILADLETDLPFVVEQIGYHITGHYMYSMLGGTVSNLDGSDGQFLETLIDQIMKPGDSLLIDLPLAGPGYSIDTERQAIFSAGPGTGPDHVELQTFRQTCGLPRTHCLRVIHRKSQKQLFNFRRYHWDSVIDWLARFDIEILYPSNASSLSAANWEGRADRHPGTTYHHGRQAGLGVVLLSRRHDCH